MMSCPLCHSQNVSLLCQVSKRPAVEVDYHIPEDHYCRDILQCEHCKVYFNNHSMLDLVNFYQGPYNQSINPTQSFYKRFQKIIDLSFETSDNKQRVNRVIQQMKDWFKEEDNLSILDVGSGTCVFLYELTKHIKVRAYCVDPDPNAIEHVRNNIPLVKPQVGTLSDISSSEKFNVITFNKVLEHVADPIQQLDIARRLLRHKGMIYLELPFGDEIAREKSFLSHAEFNMEHLTIYNVESIKYLSQRAGLEVKNIEAIRDPSGKQTIYAFLKSTHE